MGLVERARKLRNIIESAMISVDNDTAVKGAELFPRLAYNGELVKAGTRICWEKVYENGESELVVMKATSDLWDNEQNNPTNASTLWEEINYMNGYRIIPKVITTTSAFALNEIGVWKEELYKSLLEANVWTPAQKADGWEKIKEVQGDEGTEEVPSIAEWIQPNGSNPYKLGDKVTHNGNTWVSTVDANVWEPGVYGWEISE